MKAGTASFSGFLVDFTKRIRGFASATGVPHMSIVVYAEASAGTNPGHMVIGQEPIGGVPGYFGYRFDPADLPEEYRLPEQWRNYLFDNAIRGKIVDETAYVSHLLSLGESARTYYE